MNFYISISVIAVLVILDLSHVLITPSLYMWRYCLGGALMLERPRIRRPQMLNKIGPHLQNPEGGVWLAKG